MRIAVPAERRPGERRVAAVPDTVLPLVRAGQEVVVAAGAGIGALFPDDAYREVGATVRSGDVLEDADVVLHVRPLLPDDAARLRAGVVTIGFVAPSAEPAGVRALQEAGATAFAMELVPRISRAQSMDALTSQALVAGYRCVLEAAVRLPRFFPLFMTAAGTVPPARVLVLGAGVAGLQAIATARRLGAVVAGFDVRPVVREQIESLGANWLDLGIVGEETEGGYARELSPEEQQRQQQALEERIPDYDAVITTAAIPGRPAPKLIPASTVARMRPGSVIVDLASDTGGNCELTEPGEEVLRDGVTIVGLTNLAATMPFHASQLLARNVTALLQHLAPEGDPVLDWDDEITAGACVTRREEVAA
jgi:NAD(P) transhydrogenase subunit alpha